MDKTQGITIFIKGRRHVINDNKVSYDQVVQLGYPHGQRGPLFEYEVTWKDGPKENEEGTLIEGDVIEIVEGMRFYVSFTDKS